MRIRKPSISIGGEEFKCMSREVSLEPGDPETFCTYEWTCSVEVELSYGVDGSWNVLHGMQDTIQEIVISPSDAAAGVPTNPTATFDAWIPPIPFMSGAVKGEKQTFTLELRSEAEPLFDKTS
jgi:hypothetical protein